MGAGVKRVGLARQHEIPGYFEHNASAKRRALALRWLTSFGDLFLQVLKR